MPFQTMPRPAQILLVEHDPDDALLLREAVREAEIPAHLSVVPSGEQALHFLYRVNGHARSPRPDLVLLDLHLPNLSAREVLASIRADRALAALPVIVMAGAADPAALGRLDQLGVTAYLAKSPDPRVFSQTLRSLCARWLRAVHLPSWNTGDAVFRPRMPEHLGRRVVLDWL